MALRKIKSVVCDIPEVKSQLQYRGVLAMMASRVDQRINHLVGTPHGQVPTNAYEALEQVVKARPAP